MPLVVQLIPRTARRFFPYLDSGQLCQSWCLYCPKWLCRSGSSLGTLDSLSSLCPSTSLLGPWPPVISLPPSSPSIQSFPLSSQSILPLSPSCKTFLWTFTSLPEVLQLNRQQRRIRHCQTYGRMLSLKAGRLHLSGKVSTMHNWFKKKNLTGWR